MPEGMRGRTDVVEDRSKPGRKRVGPKPADQSVGETAQMPRSLGRVQGKLATLGAFGAPGPVVGPRRAAPMGERVPARRSDDDQSRHLVEGHVPVANDMGSDGAANSAASALRRKTSRVATLDE